MKYERYLIVGVDGNTGRIVKNQIRPVQVGEFICMDESDLHIIMAVKGFGDLAIVYLSPVFAEF